MGRAILLTPAGGAAIAVVRLVGPQVVPFLSRYFSRRVSEGRCVHGTLADGPRVIDDPVVVLHPGGAVVDVNVHGGPWVVRSVLELARREGFDVVERVEMPLPDEAVDAETELGREVLRYLPLARTELALRVLLAQERAWERMLAPARSTTFPPLPSAGEGRGEGGAPGVEPRNSASSTAARPPHPNPLPRRGEGTRQGTIQTALEDHSLHWLLHPPRVAIVGAPNVGKSTLANQLFAQERSITADLPGTTRDWVGEIANIDGLAVMLVDTPGVRETSDEIEREAIARGKEQVARADLVVLVIDRTRDVPEQRELLHANRAAIHVVNKSDQPRAWDVPGDATWIETVATTGQGVDRLRNAVKRHFFGNEDIEIDRPRWWTQRQRSILERALVDPTALSEI